MSDPIKELSAIFDEIKKHDAIYELRRENGKVIAIKIERKKKTCVG